MYLATRYDNILAPIHDSNCSVRVHDSQITGSETPSVESLACGLWVSEILRGTVVFE